MRLIERYLFRQLLGPTILAILALSAVALLSESLSAINILVEQRQSPVIFAEITLLALPQLIVMILPVAVFVAALVALNRLHTEQEIVICFAGGMSRWRVASPAIRLASIVALFALALNLWIQPLCYREMREVLAAVRADLTSTMIHPGEFTHPAPDLTVYGQSIDDDGVIHNLFIYQTAAKGGSTTLTASEGRIAKRNGEPVLIMHNGSNQQFSNTGVLNFLSFDEYVFDLRPFLALDNQVTYKLSDRYLHELFFPDLRGKWEQNNRKQLVSEAHARLSSPLYNLSFCAMALAAVLGGAFSRLGYGARIAAASGAAIVTRVLGVVAQAAADGNEVLNVLQYAIPVGVFLFAMLIVLRQHPVRHRRRQAVLQLAPRPA